MIIEITCEFSVFLRDTISSMVPWLVHGLTCSSSTMSFSFSEYQTPVGYKTTSNSLLPTICYGSSSRRSSTITPARTQTTQPNTGPARFAVTSLSTPFKFILAGFLDILVLIFLVLAHLAGCMVIGIVCGLTSGSEIFIQQDTGLPSLRS